MRCNICGLAGFIGESKNPVITYQLITKLFEKSEIRGVDAAGYWGTETGKDGHILYHKEPGKSSRFVKTTVWKQLFKYNINMLLVHARGASKGLGEPSVNRNNHPFVSSDYSIGLVHNGRVDDTEYAFLKKKYAVQSHCDSEMLLRIFEAGEAFGYSYLKKAFGFTSEYPQRLAGIKEIFSHIVEGHMAVAVGERGANEERMLWLFRNRHRPLWMIDVREYLGQIFFVSDPAMWEETVSEIGIKNIIRTQKLVELPTEEIWFFKITNEEPHPKNVSKYKIIKEGSELYSTQNKFYSVIKKPQRYKIITQLNENDQILKAHREFPEIIPQPDSSLNDAYIKVYKKCNELVGIIESIRGSSYNLKEEGSISCHDMEQLLQELDQQCQYLNELKTIIA